ncbi:hypothetical protein L1887_59317 [Cichorium endivia]|nr:hypothetical protein L1887_59317 [Cichorium endivia]
MALAGAGVVTSQHADGDAGLLALSHGACGLGTRRVVQTDQTEEDHVGLDIGTFKLLALLLLLVGDLAVSEGEHTEVPGWREPPCSRGPRASKSSLKSTRPSSVCDGHALDGAVKGVLGDLSPLGGVAVLLGDLLVGVLALGQAKTTPGRSGVTNVRMAHSVGVTVSSPCVGSPCP